MSIHSTCTYMTISCCRITMAPNLLGTSALFLAEATSAEPVQIISQKSNTTPLPQPKQITARSNQPQYRWQIVWRNVIAFMYLHIFAIYGLYLFLFVCTWKTFIWSKFVLWVSKALCGQNIYM